MSATAKKATNSKSPTPPPEAVKNLPAVTAAAELVTVENLTPAQVFTPDKITEFLNIVKSKVDAFKGDASTEEGRAAIISFAFQVTKSKTLIEKIGDDYAKFLKEEPKKVDKERKRWTDTVEAWATAVRAPVTALEKADKERKDTHQAYLDKIGQALTFTAPPVTANVAERIKWVSDQKTRQWDEFAGLAETTIKGVLEDLEETHKAAIKADQDAAELDRLRKAEAERVEAARIQKIKEDAVAEALGAQEKEPQTVGQILDALPQPAAPAAAAAAQAPLTPEAAHKSLILREVLASLLAYGTTEAGARALIAEILKGKIAHVTINFGDKK